MTVTLVGCTAAMGTAGTDRRVSAANTKVCSVWRPITWSSSDSDQTIREIKANNAANKAWGC